MIIKIETAFGKGGRWENLWLSTLHFNYWTGI